MERTMTRSAEKNDVDITKLFRYEKEVEIEDKVTNQKATFYLRLVGDADMNKARVFGLREASKLRLALKDPDSNERLAFISEIPEFKNTELLIETILLLMLGEHQRQAINNVDIPEPKPPKGDATQEELEKFQAAVDNYGNVYNKAVSKEITKIQKRERKELEKQKESDLYALYEGLIIDRLCSEEMSSKYYSMCVYLGTFADKDHKRRAFPTFEDFDNASSYLKDRLIDEYRFLEIGMDELKKLPEATL